MIEHMTKVLTPVKGFTGTVVGVRFDDGLGETDDTNKLGYFARHGYEIVDQPKGKKSGKKASKGKVPDPAKEPDPEPVQTAEPEPPTDPEDEANPADPETEDDTDDDGNLGVDPKTATPDVSRPVGNAPKAVWVEYALANGHSEADIAGLTQVQIRRLFDE